MSKKLNNLEYIAVICGCMIVGFSIGTQVGYYFSEKGVKMSETKAISCPNCGKPAMRTGNEITCESCDAEFVITKKQETQLKGSGKIEDHEKRLQALEQSAAGKEPQKVEPEETEEPI